MLINTTPPRANHVINGQFAAGSQGWLAWPGSPSDIRADASSGAMHFYRPAGSADGALLQATGAAVPAAAGLELTFRMGNTDNGRKRVSVILHDADWSDLSLCTFWLTPQQRPGLYVMRAQAGKAWSNATISFYASSINAAGSSGAYVLDDVALRVDRCAGGGESRVVDPARPWSGGVSLTSNLLANGDFASGALAPWIAWNDLPLAGLRGCPESEARVARRQSRRRDAAGHRRSGGQGAAASNDHHDRQQQQRPAARVADAARQPVQRSRGVPLLAVRQRAAALRYSMTMYATKAWPNAMLSIYPGSVGSSPSHEWLQVDDVVLQSTSPVTLGD